jgi:hypothetical protein
MFQFVSNKLEHKLFLPISLLGQHWGMLQAVPQEQRKDQELIKKDINYLTHKK